MIKKIFFFLTGLILLQNTTFAQFRDKWPAINLPVKNAEIRKLLKDRDDNLYTIFNTWDEYIDSNNIARYQYYIEILKYNVEGELLWRKKTNLGNFGGTDTTISRGPYLSGAGGIIIGNKNLYIAGTYWFSNQRNAFIYTTDLEGDSIATVTYPLIEADLPYFSLCELKSNLYCIMYDLSLSNRELFTIYKGQFKSLYVESTNTPVYLGRNLFNIRDTMYSGWGSAVDSMGITTFDEKGKVLKSVRYFVKEIPLMYYNEYQSDTFYVYSPSFFIMNSHLDTLCTYSYRHFVPPMPGTGWPSFNSFMKASDGYLYAIGYSTALGNAAAFIHKFDIGGKSMYAFTYSPSYLPMSWLKDIVEVPDGLIMSAYKIGDDFGSWMIKIDKDGYLIDTKDITPKENNPYMIGYPNPCKEECLLRFKEETNGRITVYDIQGHMVYSQYVRASELRLNTSFYIPGLYIVRYIDNKTGKSGTTKIIKSTN